MKRILLSTLAVVAFGASSMVQTLSTETSVEAAPQAASDHHEKTSAAKTSEDMVKEIESRVSKIKDAGESLSAEMKSEFNYFIDVIAAEIKVLTDTANKNTKKHYANAQRTLHSAEGIIKKYVHQVEHAKRVAEREAKAKLKAEERKARAEERKAKAEARKAERAAAKAKREAEHAMKKSEHISEHHETTPEQSMPESDSKEVNPEAPKTVS